MKGKILLTASFIVCIFFAAAQDKPDRAFAIVSTTAGTAQWMNIQEIDLSTGKVIRSVFEKGQTGFVLVDAVTRKKISTKTLQSQNGKLNEADEPTATMVAAAAFDKRHNKLYFTPMRLAELRWIDVEGASGALKVYCLRGQPFSSSDLNKEDNHITRMAIASDGFGYALSNDGNIFTRFSTGKKPAVTQLGGLKDDSKNKDISIHERPNWGGDMIADAMGNLFVIGANRAVFKINIQSRIATHLGFMEGLPDNFSTNGAAVDKNGELIISSAQSAEGFYKADLLTLKAYKPDVQSEVLSSADLATGNLAFDKPADEMQVFPATKLIYGISQKALSVYPNPVTAGHLKVDFRGYAAGPYEVNLVDINGKIISQKKVIINGPGQTEGITLNANLARGIYLVKVVDASRKVLSSGKILLE